MLESGHIGRNRAGSLSYILGIYGLVTLLQSTLYGRCQYLTFYSCSVTWYSKFHYGRLTSWQFGASGYMTFTIS